LDAANEAKMRAEKAAGDVNLNNARKGLKVAGVAALLEEALGMVKDASGRIDASNLRDTASEAGKRATAALSKVDLPEVDADKTGKLLDDLRDRLVAAVESVRGDLAPKAVDTLRGTVIPTVQEAAQTVAHRVQEDVLPQAQEAVGKLREDVLPSAQDQVSKLAENYDVAGRARRAGEGARSGATNLSGVLQTVALAIIDKMVQDILPEARRAGSKAATVAKEDVLPAAAKTAGEAAHRVREDVLPRVGDTAAKTPDMLSDLLSMARERATEAMDRATPAMADAATFSRHRAADVKSAVKENRKSVGKAANSAKSGVTGAVGSVVGATTYTAKETTGILWWLSMLGAMILLVFVPERDKQEEFWNNLRQFLGEVREMWRDLQGPDEYDTFDTGTPTTQ
jgi:hypothetical protein